jgi:hypothetical protein
MDSLLKIYWPFTFSKPVLNHNSQRSLMGAADDKKRGKRELCAVTDRRRKEITSCNLISVNKKIRTCELGCSNNAECVSFVRREKRSSSLRRRAGCAFVHAPTLNLVAATAMKADIISAVWSNVCATGHSIWPNAKCGVREQECFGLFH